MAYNPYFPIYNNNMTNGYQNPYTMQSFQERMNFMYPQQNNYPMQQQMMNGQDIPFVDGYEGAMAYPISAGKEFLLMDSKAQKFYIKKLDNQGYPIIQVFDFKAADTTPKNIIEVEPTIEKVDYENLKMDFSTLKEDYDELKNDYKQFKEMSYALIQQFQGQYMTPPIQDINNINKAQTNQAEMKGGKK